MATALALLALPGQAGADQSLTVNEFEFGFTPSSVDVTPGQVVHFTIRNTGAIEHNFTVELESAHVEKRLFDTNLKPGETRTADFTFTQAGKWTMYCPVDRHEDRGMKGDINVSAAAASTPGPATAAPPPAPTPAVAAPVSAPAPAVPAPAPVAPAPAAQPTRPPGATAPTQLPRTGGLPPLAGAVPLLGLALLGGGLLVRRRR